MAFSDLQHTILWPKFSSISIVPNARGCSCHVIWYLGPANEITFRSGKCSSIPGTAHHTPCCNAKGAKNEKKMESVQSKALPAEPNCHVQEMTPTSGSDPQTKQGNVQTPTRHGRQHKELTGQHARPTARAPSETHKTEPHVRGERTLFQRFSSLATTRIQSQIEERNKKTKT